MGVFTETVVPTFGNLLATAMLLSPFPAVLRLRSTGKLGDLNPLPYPMTCVNAAGWVAYGYAVSNPWVFPANIVGLLAGLFFTFTAFSCAPRKVQDRITAIFVVAAGYIIMLGLIACFGLSQKASERLWGTSAVVILMLYYFVPLSTMVDIVRTRNAASIYPPLAATAIANGAMWTVYGLAVQDINLWLPNLFGAVIGMVQLGLRLLYGARPVVAAGAAVPEVDTGRSLEDEEMAFAMAHGADPADQVDGRLHSGSNLLLPRTAPSTTPAGNGVAPVGLSHGVSQAASTGQGALGS